MSYSILRQIRISLLVLAAMASLAPGIARAAGGPLNFHSLVPCRVFDSRNADAPALSGGVERIIQVTGECGVPADAEAVSLNVTVVDGTTNGEMFLYAGDAATPTVGGLHFPANRTRARVEIVELASDVSGTIAALADMDAGQSAHLILDVNGYFMDSALAVNDAVTVNEDSGATTLDVRLNDNGPPGGGPFTIASVTQPANGTVVITNAGADLTYEPDPDYCNDGTPTDNFTYTLTPGNSTATVAVTVDCVDDDPVAVDDSATVLEDAAATTIDVLANDTDADGGAISITSVTQPANGTVVITNAGADLTYQPDAGYCNDGSPTDDFTYTLTPGGDTATVTVTVTCADDLPTAVDDAATVAEDSSNNAIDVLANDTDTDGGPKSVASVTQPANGTVVITGGGTGVSYTPNANYCNTPPGTTLDTFTYTLNGGSTATVSVTVTCADDNPTAVNDAATVNEDSTNNAIDVLANDTDVDGGTISVTSVTQPANGTVVITGGGTGVSYTPNADYCNNPPGTTPDTFTYTLSPGGSTATVSVTVDCSDDSPTAVNDAATVTEDSGANTINVQANDTDPDGGTNTISGVTQPANGTVVITNAGADLTYAPNANYCNNPPGTTPDTFTYTLSPGGSVATVSVTVTCVDDPPAAVNDIAAVNEDSGANTINVLANDADLDGGTNTIVGVTQPANGAVVITNGGLDLTYTPNANYCNNPPGTTPDTFNYTLSPGGSTATVSVTVACLNDGPVIDLDADDDKGTAGSDFAVTFTEGDPATLLEDPLDATVTDVDNATLASLTVTITNLLDIGNETLSADVTSTSITASYVAATGVLTLTGPDTLANFQTVLRKVRYLNSDTAPDTTPRVIHFVANDGTADGNTAVSTVTVVNVDTPPTAVNDTATVNEDSSNNAIDVLANDTDPDGGPISITSVTQPANGTVAITGGGTGVSYTPNANYCNSVSGTPDTFTYTLTPGGSTATVSVTVTCFDDNPTAVNDAATVNEDSGANAISVLANDTDADGGPISVTSVTQPANGTVAITGGGTGVSYTPNANYCNNPPGTTPDTFTYTLTPGGSVATVTVTVTCVEDNPVAVADAATVVEDSGANAINVLANDTDVDGGAISITSVTQPANGAVVITGGGTGLTYQPNANYCNSVSGIADTFTYALAPGGSSTTVTVTVTCVDDPPVAVADAATIIEDSGANAIGVLANDTDVDGGAISITSVTQPANGAVVITGGGTGLTYQPNLNYCNSLSGTPDTFTYTLTPGGSSTTVSVTVTCVNDPPVAVDDIFDTIGNTQLRVDLAAASTPHVLETTGGAPFGVLDGNPLPDSDPVENNAIALTGIVGCGDVSAPFGDSPVCTTANGGTVILEANGSFSYLPPAGHAAASDSFEYTIQDNGVPAPAGDTGLVTINRLERVWYVDPTAAGGGNGTSASPFNSLTALNGASGAGDSDVAADYIFIHDGTLAGSIEMEANQHLIGEGAELSIPVNLNGNGSPTSLVPAGTRPQLTNASGDTVRVTTAIPVKIVGLSLASTTGNAIDLTSTAALSGSATLTIDNNELRGAGAEGIDINLNAGTNGTLAVNFTNNSWSLAGTHAGNSFDARTASATANLRVNFSNNTNVYSTAAGSSGVFIDGSGGGSLIVTGFSANSIHQNTVGHGIQVVSATFDSNTGTAGFQQVSGGNTVIGTPGDSVGGLGMSLVNVQGNLFYSDLDIFAGGGVGLRVSGTGGGMTFGTSAAVAIVEATGGPAVDVTSTALTLPLTSLKSANSATTGVALNSITGSFSAGAGSSISNITSAAGTAFQVGSSNATISYAGTITNNNGKGVDLTSNTGSTIGFTGTLTLTSGTNTGFNATGGGTVTATDTASTVTTTTGTALNVASTTIGAGGLKFRSIASNGAASGIVLNSTGSIGGLTVSGNGGTCTVATPTCTGGTIQSSTGAGVNLTNTAGANLSLMRVTGGGGDGIVGSSVTGFTLSNSLVTNNGNALGEHGLDFSGLLGTASITSSTISGSHNNNASIRNSSGTLTLLTVSGSTFSSNVSTSDGDGLLFEASGTANMSINVSGSTFSAHHSDHFQASALNSGVLNVVFSGNTLSGGHAAPLGQGITINAATGAPGFAGSVTYDVNGNTINGAISNAIMANLGTSSAAAAFNGQIRNNVIGTSGSALSCSTQANGINVEVHGNGTHTVSVTGNTIRRCFDRGINALANDGNGVFNLTATNNTVTEMSDTNGVTGTPREAFILQAGSTSTNVFGQIDSHAVCMSLSGPSGSLVGGAFKNGDIRVRQRFRTSIRMPGYGGTPFDTAAVIGFLQGNNPGSTATATASDDAGVTTDGYFGGAACPLP